MPLRMALAEQSHAGPQQIEIATVADRPRTERGKFIAPEKKTGVPTAKAGSAKAAKKSASKKAPKKAEARKPA